MPTIGPYEFTDEDAERTLALTSTFFDLFTEGLPPERAAPIRAAAATHRARAEAAHATLMDEVTASGTADGTAVALGEVWDAWRAAAADIRATGALGPEALGTVVGLFRSDTGVPKTLAESVEVGWSGVVGDRQGDRRNHGRPWQALCLWSQEVIDDLAAQGHPVAPGSAGENITVAGIVWDRLRPGSLVQVGGVLAEMWAYALPCKTTAASFNDGHFDVMHHRHGPVSRVYAAVIEPGTIHLGDVAMLVE